MDDRGEHPEAEGSGRSEPAHRPVRRTGELEVYDFAGAVHNLHRTRGERGHRGRELAPCAHAFSTGRSDAQAELPRPTPGPCQPTLCPDLAAPALEVAHDNFHYIPCISRETEPEGFRMGRADDVAFSDHTNLTDWRIFLCGYPPMVNSARNRAINAGAKIEEIFLDPFELKNLRKVPRQGS